MESIMNKETVEGKFDQAAGVVKQKAGEAFGNQKLANSGVADQIKGAAKETWGKTKDAISERRDDTSAQADVKKEDLKARAEEKADHLRDEVVNTAHNIKNSISEKIDSFRHKDNA
jgi:uncharacterized protein YjbJ (UPF0337 family)